MAKLIVSHEVADFKTWKEGYDAHAEGRKAAGVVDATVYQDASNPNKVYIFSEIESIEKTKEMFNNPEMQEVMKKSGVTSKPEFAFLNEA